MKKRGFTKEFKAKAALEAIKGQRPINELALEFGVHPSQLTRWKKQLMEAAPDIFGSGRNRDAEQAEAELDKAYKKLGQLQVEVDWLKKKTGHPQ
jgi:transposase